MAIVNADSLSAADIAVASTAAGPGGTVILPSGTLPYTAFANFAPLADQKWIGQGIGQTVIEDSVASGQESIRWNLPSTGIFRLSGLTLKGGTGASTKNNGTLSFYTSGSRLRMDNVRFHYTSPANAKIAQFNAGLFGGMRDCAVDTTGNQAAFYFYNGRDDGTGQGQGNYEFTLPHGMGSNQFFFVENNIFTCTTRFGRVSDCFIGARVVIRFNTFHNCGMLEQHATGASGDAREARCAEVYCNKVTSDLDEPNFAAMDWENGTGVAWGNDWSNAGQPVFNNQNCYKNGIIFKITRINPATYAQGAPGGSGWGYCASPRATGTCNVTGTAVTHVSGDLFDTSWPAGTIIRIAGMTAEGSSGQEPADGPGGRINSVDSTSAITLGLGGHTGSPLTSAVFHVGSVWDGNQTGTGGYPCLDQPGRGQGDLIVGSFGSANKRLNATGQPGWPNQASEPIYFWKNVGGIRSGWGGSAISNSAGSSRVAANRDYYPQNTTEHTNPATAITAGTSFGTLANRPSATICTEGVGYFATDDGDWNTTESNDTGVQVNGASGVLYVVEDVLGTNEWVEYYEPEIYPLPELYDQTGNTLTSSGTTTVSGVLTLP